MSVNNTNMKGLEQGRAKFAYEKAKHASKAHHKKESKAYAKQLPMMIKSHGLGASLAFACICLYVRRAFCQKAKTRKIKLQPGVICTKTYLNGLDCIKVFCYQIPQKTYPNRLLNSILSPIASSLLKSLLF